MRADPSRPCSCLFPDLPCPSSHSSSALPWPHGGHPRATGRRGRLWVYFVPVKIYYYTGILLFGPPPMLPFSVRLKNDPQCGVILQSGIITGR